MIYIPKGIELLNDGGRTVVLDRGLVVVVAAQVFVLVELHVLADVDPEEMNGRAGSDRKRAKTVGIQ